MEQEISHHLELQAAELQEEGVSADEAAIAARRMFGNLAGIHERCREERYLMWLRQLGQDLRYGGRALYRSPVFTLAVVLTLACGIGANTAIFSLVDQIFLKQLPVSKPSQLVLFHWASEKGLPVPTNGDWEVDPVTKQQTCTSFSQLTFERFKAQNQTMTDVFAFVDIPRMTVIADGNAEVVKLGEIVSGNCFSVLGVAPAAGRLINKDDDLPGAVPVAVISYSYWQRRFEGDPSTIGKYLLIDRQTVMIIGVTPPRFSGTLQVGDAPDLYLPLSLAPRLDLPGREIMGNPAKLWWLRIMGRLRPNIFPDQVRANLEATFQQTALDSLSALGEKTLESPTDFPSLGVGPGGQGLTELRNSYAQEWKILAGLAITILVIACANIASLLLARGSSRQREIGIRLATGASRDRIVRQFLTESALLALLGGTLAIPFALWVEDILVAMQPPLEGHVLVLHPQLDLRIFAIAAAFSILIGTIVGLIPALRSTRVDITTAFQGGSGTRSGGTGSLRSVLGKTLLVLQIALSLILLVGSGLFVETLRNLKRVDLGFDPGRILLFQLNPNPDGAAFDRGAEKNRQIADRIRSLPGVQACTFSKMAVLSGMGWNTRISVPDEPKSELTTAMVNAVSDDFFSTYEMPIILGRALTLSDETRTSTVAVINHTMAVKCFGSENPVGRLLEQKDYTGKTISIEIVGVARDAKYSAVRDPVPSTIFFPFSFSRIMLSAEGTFAVRTPGNPEGLVSLLRDAVHSVDPLLPLANIRTQESQIAELSAHERLFAWLSGFFSLLAIALVSIGLYGLMAYTVERRTSEIGLRMALGARSAKILCMVLGECLKLASIGVALGLVVAYAATRIVHDLLYGLSATDPGTFVMGALLLLAIALFAGLVPAWRAARLDPVDALRCE